ncbi:PIR protein CIR protein [Plasmodium vinckei]|uniref:PIR protein CIR protein n=1 Tax=Plasmodium vinckei TaxID=5860 RepID=A0A6V7S9C0_PLAVN|nr:PIR protein CIR protein [Plasmodium vinckei]
MDPKVCDFLHEVDEYFTKGIVNEKKFNKFTECHSYCPYENNLKENKCTNNYERINALGSYLFNKIHEFDKTYSKKYGVSKHIEIFMIWLGSKSFKMDNDYKATLEEYYKNHLENIMVNAIYWKTISKNLYKNATIRKMDELYSLLDNVCKLITEYNKKPTNPNRKSLGNHAVQCRNFYKTIHKSINECKPYLHLLDSVKMMYENFRSQKIDNNYNIPSKDRILLLKSIQPLITFNNENKLFVPVAANFSFDDKECKEAKSNDEKIGKQIALTKSQDFGKSKNPARRAQTRVSENLQRGNPGSLQLKQPFGKSPTAARPQQKPGAKQQQASQSQTQPVAPVKSTDTQKSDPPPVSSHKPGLPPAPPSASSKKDTKLNTPQTGEIHKNGPGGPGDGKGDSNSDPGVKSSGSSGGQGSGAHGSGGTGVRSGDQAGKGDAGNGGNGGDSAQGDQGKSPGGTGSVQGGQAKGPKDISRGNPAPASSGTGTTPSSPPEPKTQEPKTQESKPPESQPKKIESPPQQQSQQQPQPQPQPQQQSDPPTADPSSPQKGTPLPKPQEGGSDSQNAPKTSDNSKENTGGTNDNTGDPSSGNKNLGGGSSDPTSSTSGGSFDWESSIFEFILKGKEYYDKASEFIEKNRQTFEDTKDKIRGAYNDTVENLKSTYNASSDYLNKFISDVTSHLNQFDTPPKSGSSGNNLPQNSDQSQKNGNPPPIPPSKDPQPPSPQITPPAPPSNPMQNPIQDPPKGSLQQNQSPPQPQYITHQNPHFPAQINQPNSQKIGQLIKSLSSDIILKKPWNIFPTTWNGSGDCKPEIKFMNATLVCCTSEQCSLTGIPVILVLIPIILLIAYKYLSFVSSKKSEKKNMKKVINFHDGNRKTKIIISSCDKKKDLKPVINSVSGKKDSLLNIYKLIQADPMPFINLFFLLIFFVYKRKRDTIE